MAISRKISGPALNRDVPTGNLNLGNQIYGDGFPCQLNSSSEAVDGANSGSPLSEDCDATLRFINQMLNEEEDLQNKPCMFPDILALQATEKSFYNALVSSPQEDSSSDCASGSPNQSKASDRVPDERNLHDYVLQTVLRNFSSANTVSPARDLDRRDDSPTGSRSRSWRRRRRKAREVDDDDDDSEIVGPSNKQLARYPDESEIDELQEAYDKALLCPILNPHLHQNCDGQICRCGKSSNRYKAHGKKVNCGKGDEMVDLSTLLVNCAQSASSFDMRSAYDILKQIRHHSSPHGNGTQRLAHFFANALEARLAGTGKSSYAAFNTKRISSADILRGYQIYVTASPFNKASNSYANKSIMKVVANADSLHIIDFGILYGFQWPCLIQSLSVRPGGPPKLRITGIDFPQPGFRPAERIDETGRRLATYCNRFKVPFQFTSIAKKWDDIEIGDLDIKPGELLVVNSMNRLRNLPDETVVILDSPRDALLKVIRRLNPDLFIHGEMTGMYSAPFFVTRFREAVFHFSSWFDMFDTIVGRENRGRMLFEEMVMGKDIMNVVACEGFERIERPETYKQWQVRIRRAGFKQQDLNWDVVEETVANVKKKYHKEFSVDTDGKWMLQGWKGRIIYCVSCWKPS